MNRKPESSPTLRGRVRERGTSREFDRLVELRRLYERLLPMALDPEGPWPPDAVARQATVLFSDLRGFSALAESYADDPARLLELVNVHLSAVVRAILRCGAIVEKFVGDGVFATFGAHGEMPDHYERGLAAALAVVGANEAMNRRHADEWGFRLDVGVGVASGKVVTGLVGVGERAELAVLGDAVNIAARLVASARTGEILLAASTYQQVAGKIRGELLGMTPVRGRSGEVEIYRLLVIPPRVTTRPRPAPPRRTGDSTVRPPERPARTRRTAPAA
jgi:adenylate cyclase